MDEEERAAAGHQVGCECHARPNCAVPQGEESGGVPSDSVQEARREEEIIFVMV